MRTQLSLLALALMAATGCDPTNTETGDTSAVDCTASAAGSVNVSIVDQDGAALVPETVSYTVDGGDALDADCVGDPCTEYVAGWEVSGEITVTATYYREHEKDPLCSYEDSASETVTVEMTADGCHVQPQTMTLQLDTTQELCI